MHNTPVNLTTERRVALRTVRLLRLQVTSAFRATAFQSQLRQLWARTCLPPPKEADILHRLVLRGPLLLPHLASWGFITLRYRSVGFEEVDGGQRRADGNHKSP